MPINNSQSADTFGYDNMRSQAVRNVGKPRHGTDGMTWGVPSYTTTERDALDTSIIGKALIFNSTTSKLNFYDGSAWRVITST